MLEDFDDDFPTATQTAAKDVLKDLPDGLYEFAVKSFAVKETNSGPLVSMKLELLTEGPHAGGEAERTYWLTKKDDATGLRVKNEQQLANLRKDLETLGFDVSNWTKENGRPFSVEVGKVGACIQGVCFKGKKKANQNGGKTFHNLYVNERSKEDGKPAAFGAAEMNEANADPFGD